jgi:hypothetical protein
MRNWLRSLQRELDKVTSFGLSPIDDISSLAKMAVQKNVTLNEEFLLARQLLCSSGTTFSCKDKVCI